jgi:hypothetical protein
MWGQALVHADIDLGMSSLGARRAGNVSQGMVHHDFFQPLGALSACAGNPLSLWLQMGPSTNSLWGRAMSKS